MSPLTCSCDASVRHNEHFGCSKKWKGEGSPSSLHPDSMDVHHSEKLHEQQSSSSDSFKSYKLTEDVRSSSLDAEASGGESGASVEKAGREETKKYYRQYYKFQSERDFAAFWRSFELLEYSCWFHADMDREEAKERLERAAVGSFLLRPSASPSHVFTLSLRLESNPVSCRINYRRGLFRLDSVGDDATNPWFEDVAQLVDWYVRSTRRDPQRGGLNFVMRKGEKRAQGTAKVIAPSRHSVPTLAHCCRLAVNEALPEVHFPSISVDKLPVPEKVKAYLKEYPYIV